MRKLTLFFCLLVLSFCINAQDQDSSDLVLRSLVDSAFKATKEENSIADLPEFGRYYIMKVRFMNDSLKRHILYTADNNSLIIYKDPLIDNTLDTLDVSKIRSISFRRAGRTGDVLSKSAAAGFLAGGAAGYVSRICWDCDSDGEPNLNAIGTGVVWGAIGAAAGVTVGLLVAMFNNGSFTIRGDLRKYQKKQPKIKRFSVLR
ncbi:MAG TPA: hypothetical protein VFX73_12765 [Chitinophagaceae bacterium]|nr:hypothetical protein [Chitinophagaceae bacterium]